MKCISQSPFNLLVLFGCVTRCGIYFPSMCKSFNDSLFECELLQKLTGGPAKGCLNSFVQLPGHGELQGRDTTLPEGAGPQIAQGERGRV